MDYDDLGHLQPLQPPRPEIEAIGLAVPQQSKDHTYLFFINGLDPYYIANFRAQCQYMKTIGYSNSFCGKLKHVELFRSKIIDVRKEDPQAHVVVVGYSFGANCARTLANLLKEDNVRIDLLVYLGGDTIMDSPASRPTNVNQVLNITAHGFFMLGGDLLFHGQDIQGASNHRVDAKHFFLPTRAEVTELLIQYIAGLDRAIDPAVIPASHSTRN